MKETLEAFFSAAPEVSRLIGARQTEAVAVFAYFLSEIADRPITVGNIEACYDAARVKAPRNICDVMSRSGSFVKTKDGWVLQRDAALRLRALIPTASADTTGTGDAARRRTVMVVYGRDEPTRLDIFSFLRSIDLQPVEWNEAVIRTGRATPYVGETRDGSPAMQPRPNVILEAGMALATDERRTILVSVGPVVIRLNNSPERRNDLVQR
jgi:hypothetical protein